MEGSKVIGDDTDLIYRGFISKGGCGEVHRIFSHRIGGDIARKVLNRVGRNELNELNAVRRLCVRPSCINIVEVFDVKRLPAINCDFIDMELCDFNLATYIQQTWDDDLKKRVPYYSNFRILSIDNKRSQVFGIIKDIVQGLVYIHNMKEIHRDIKPENVLYSCKHGVWKIGDFGFTVTGGSQPRDSSQQRGTAGYRAPELLRNNQYSYKVDVWGLGCLFFEILFRKRAFLDDYVIQRGESVKIPTRSELCNPRIEGMIYRLLDVEPKKRPTAQRVLNLLDFVFDFTIPSDSYPLEQEHPDFEVENDLYIWDKFPNQDPENVEDSISEEIVTEDPITGEGTSKEEHIESRFHQPGGGESEPEPDGAKMEEIGYITPTKTTSIAQANEIYGIEEIEEEEEEKERKEDHEEILEDNPQHGTLEMYCIDYITVNKPNTHIAAVVTLNRTYDSQLRLWEAKSGSLLWHHTFVQTSQAVPGFNLDGRYLCFQDINKQSKICLLDVVATELSPSILCVLPNQKCAKPGFEFQAASYGLAAIAINENATRLALAAPSTESSTRLRLATESKTSKCWNKPIDINQIHIPDSVSTDFSVTLNYGTYPDTLFVTTAWRDDRGVLITVFNVRTNQNLCRVQYKWNRGRDWDDGIRVYGVTEVDNDDCLIITVPAMIHESHGLFKLFRRTVPGRRTVLLNHRCSKVAKLKSFKGKVSKTFHDITILGKRIFIFEWDSNGQGTIRECATGAALMFGFDCPGVSPGSRITVHEEKVTIVSPSGTFHLIDPKYILTKQSRWKL